MANFFTSKKGVKIIAVSLALTVVAVTSISVMVPSYLNYQKYYSEVMSEREHQKYLDSLPLEFLGIEAKLNDGVEYFTDGKARLFSKTLNDTGIFFLKQNRVCCHSRIFDFFFSHHMQAFPFFYQNYFSFLH